MKLSWKLALTLRVAAVLALGAALVPMLATPAQAQTPTITTTPDPGSGPMGTTLKDSATLAGAANLDGTGSITFNLYGPGDTTCATSIHSETVPDISTDGPFDTSTGYVADSAGTYNWIASFSGDSNNSPASTLCGDEQVTVNPASPTITTTPDPGSGPMGTTLKDSATLAGAANLDGTGSITFNLYGPGDTTCATSIHSETVPDISTDGPFDTSTGYVADSAGTYNWIASFSGDSNNSPASTLCGDEQVTVNPASPTITTTPDPGSGPMGTTLKDSATLAGAANLDGTGSITFNLYGPGDTTCATSIHSETVPDISTDGPFDTSTGYVADSAGTYNWIASFSGDSNNSPASTLCGDEQVTVNPASPTITTTPDPGSGPMGTTLKDSATLAGAANLDGTGSITFNLYGPGDTTCATSIHSETVPDISTDGPFDTSTGYVADSAGTYNWIASFSGDSNNSPASTLCGDEQVTVSAAVVTPPPPPPPTPKTITQTAPFSNSTTMIKSASFTDTLTTTGNTGAVTFTTTSAPPGSAGGIKISSSGVVTTTGALSAGTYRASGTDSDSSGDTGTWRFSLTVSATAITQMPPTTGTTTTRKAFSGQLKVSGSHGAVTYAQLTGAPHLTVSPSGKVSAPATLVAGEYRATGTVKDTSGDSGTWGFSLTVSATKLAQTAPTTATTTTGKAFSGRLGVSGAHGTVTYSQSTGSPLLTVSSSGRVSASATLAAGTYKATGMTRDTYGDTGSWSFTLTVTANKISQIAPTTATAVQGKAYSAQLEVSGAHGTVTYTQTSGAPQLTVSSSGRVSAPTNLAAGTHKATGTTKDALGDTGTWSFTLTVTVAVITLNQIAPTTATTTPGKAFSGQLQVSGARGTVTYAETSGAPDLTVSSSGKISAPASLVAGTYRATGTVKDSTGDTGTWSFALTVGATTIAQVAPTTATTTTGKAFSGQLGFSGAHGKVTYAETTGAPQLTVSSSGSVSAPANLVAGTYKATGTAKDASGDAGAWSFALTVTATTLSQTAPQNVTTSTGKAFSTQLKVSGAHGVVTYAQSTGALVVKVSSAGKVSATATVLAGTYKATGSDRDSLGDTGKWSFDLTIVATKLLQTAPDSARMTTGKAFSGQLGISGAHGTVTYAQSGGRASSRRLVVGQGLGRGNLGGGDLQGHGHRPRQPRRHRHMEFCLDGRCHQAHPGCPGLGEDHDRQGLLRPARDLGRARDGHLRPVGQRASSRRLVVGQGLGGSDLGGGDLQGHGHRPRQPR